MIIVFTSFTLPKPITRDEASGILCGIDRLGDQCAIANAQFCVLTKKPLQLDISRRGQRENDGKGFDEGIELCGRE